MTYRAMYRPKDWQVSKVYAAENAAFLSDRPFFKSNEDVQVFVDKMIKSAWFQRRFKSTRSIRVLRNHGGTRAYGNHNGGAAYIKLPSSDWGRSWPVVLHEIGHAVTPRWVRGVETPWHGREFCHNFLELVNHCMGKEAADRLKAEYKKLKVQWRKKRVLAPETVEKMRERGRALAAKQHGRIHLTVVRVPDGVDKTWPQLSLDLND